MGNYTFDDNGNIRLTTVNQQIRCNCGNIIALNSELSIIIKGSILFDRENNNFVLRCHKCKKINFIKN